MRHFPFQKFALAGFALAGAAIFTLAALTWDFTLQSLRAASFVSHTHEAISAFGAVEAQLLRAEASQRDYLADLAPAHARRRDAAIDALRRELDAVALLTQDNASQAHRIAELRTLVGQRVADLRAVVSTKYRLAEGVEAGTEFARRFQELVNEERRLLMLREAEQESRAQTAGRTFIALLVALVVGMVAVLWRVGADQSARRRAEVAAETERRYDAAHARALILFNETNNRAAALNGTLALLAEIPAFPVSAFYAHEEVGGALRLTATHGAPADTQPVLRADDGLVGNAVRTGKPVYLESFDPATGMRIETGLASVRPAAMLFTPVLHQGKVLGVLALAAASRVTERERAFVERLCAQLAVALRNLGRLEGLNQLADQLRASGEEIHQKNEQLEHASRMKSEFVANMSHELRTPLNAVIGFSEIMLDGLAGEVNEEQKEYIGDIRDGGKHLLALINDVLDMSKVEAGLMALELAPVAPIELSTSGVAVVREKTLTRGIEVSVSVAPGLGRVWIDQRKTKQIVYNLLANAVKFTPDGGNVSLALRKVDRSRVEAVHAADDTRVFAPADFAHAAWLEIEVTDSGIGIAPAGLRGLFQPFVQIDSTLSRRFAGTGLGLTMVQRLVELHGGGLMVQSALGQGSTFTVWLPWRDAPAGTARAETALDAGAPLLAAVAGAAPQSAPLVLLIEDDPRAVSLMQLQLREAGYRLEVARNAASGLEQAATLQPQAIVLDIMLPGMGGWDTLARLKQHEATRHIPVVIVSITDEPRRGFALGAAQVLVKPVAQEDLLAALSAAGLPSDNNGGSVLVVDDDPKSVTIVCTHLQGAGFTPEAAYGGQQALEAVTRAPPDLIVLDLMMPNVSGFDVLEELGRKPETADVPVVVLTSKLITPEDRDRLRGRVQRIIEKPGFQPASLLAEVKRTMARNRHAST